MTIGRRRKWIVWATFTFLFVCFLKTTDIMNITDEQIEQVAYKQDRENYVNWRNLTKSEIGTMSTLGRIQFLEEDPPKIEDSKSYKILFWKYGSTIENRHLKQYSDKRVDPFRGCSVKNCNITFKDEDISDANIVIFHMHRMNGIHDIPKGKRDPHQLWAFLTDESPYHMFMKASKLSDFNDYFNWSMTYRMDSDIPVPYGRTRMKENEQKKISEGNLPKKRDTLITILGSNCGGKNNRWKYVKELQKHIKVDVYGKCGNLSDCPGHFRSDCPTIDDYLFYLAFENSNCDEYVTEKAWWNAYSKKSIPIIMGASRKNLENILPPGSYIHVDEYATPKDLAQHILYLNRTGEYEKYFRWQSKYEVINEHGYFKSPSFHFCRICEALNYNDKGVKVYHNLMNFWNTSRDCHPSWDSKK